MAVWILRLGLAIFLLLAGLGAWATITVGNGALVRFNPDPGALRPREYVVLLDPFRDRKPETLAESEMEKLRRGDISELRTIQTSEFIRQRETQYPIRSWRVGRRWDHDDTVTILYWVRRGGGYAGGDDSEEEATFGFARNGSQWTLVSFAAIY